MYKCLISHCFAQSLFLLRLLEKSVIVICYIICLPSSSPLFPSSYLIFLIRFLFIALYIWPLKNHFYWHRYILYTTDFWQIRHNDHKRFRVHRDRYTLFSYNWGHHPIWCWYIVCISTLSTLPLGSSPHQYNQQEIGTYTLLWNKRHTARWFFILWSLIWIYWAISFI